RTAWYNQAPAHNTLTFDGKAADAKPSNRTPASLFRTDRSGLVGEVKATDFGPAATWQRGIFWIAGDYYVILDRVQAKQAGTISATLHGGRGGLSQSEGHYTWHYPQDPYGPAAALHTWFAAPGAMITEKSGELTYIKGDYAAFPYLQWEIVADSSAWLTLLKPTADGDASAFKVQNLSTPAFSALAIMAPNERTLMAGQSKPGSIMKAGDLESDASFALVRRDEKGRVLNYCALEATYLRIHGQELWRSATPQNFDSGVRPVKPAAELTDTMLTKPIVSVVDKGQPSPGGDVHDYISFARYWWPDPAKPNGLPYLSRDGQHNRAQVAKGDHAKLFQLIDTVDALTKRWTEHHDAAAARRAVEWLQAWFITPATRMNPHLDYAQIRLGHDQNRGNPSGVLDARGFGELVESVQQLAETKVLASADLKIIRQWFTDYLHWLTTAPIAKEEAAAKNNHGSWYLAQAIAIARFVGEEDLARKLCVCDLKRLDRQIMADGSQPFELTRADSLGYSVFNLEAQFRVARLAALLGIDLWHHGRPKGGSLRQALDYLRPYNQHPEQWPHPQNAKLKPGFLNALLTEAAQIWPTQPGHEATK
ncbi:MAG: alginate lyase family protein, partial [Cephaloticoccus sp.]|nr:alginate lyase family protein [Cephaloticoccus sp.]